MCYNKSDVLAMTGRWPKRAEWQPSDRYTEPRGAAVIIPPIQPDKVHGPA